MLYGSAGKHETPVMPMNASRFCKEVSVKRPQHEQAIRGPCTDKPGSMSASLQKRLNCCVTAKCREVPIATDAPQHDWRKKKDRQRGGLSETQGGVTLRFKRA